MTRIVILLTSLLLAGGCGDRILLSDADLMTLSTSEVRELVIGRVPINCSRAKVERTLRSGFHKEWRVIDYESRQLIAQRGFSVPIGGGYYYLISDLAVVARSLYTSDVMTVYLLFDRENTLRDVAANKWTDGP